MNNDVSNFDTTLFLSSIDSKSWEKLKTDVLKINNQMQPNFSNCLLDAFNQSTLGDFVYLLEEVHKKLLQKVEGN